MEDELIDLGETAAGAEVEAVGGAGAGEIDGDEVIPRDRGARLVAIMGFPSLGRCGVGCRSRAKAQALSRVFFSR
jgi:hypothetical protein